MERIFQVVATAFQVIPDIIDINLVMSVVGAMSLGGAALAKRFGKDRAELALTVGIWTAGLCIVGLLIGFTIQVLCSR